MTVALGDLIGFAGIIIGGVIALVGIGVQRRMQVRDSAKQLAASVLHAADLAADEYRDKLRTTKPSGPNGGKPSTYEDRRLGSEGASNIEAHLITMDAALRVLQLSSQRDIYWRTRSIRSNVENFVSTLRHAETHGALHPEPGWDDLELYEEDRDNIIADITHPYPLWERPRAWVENWPNRNLPPGR